MPTLVKVWLKRVNEKLKFKETTRDNFTFAIDEE
jgi:hypothetical protein